MPGRVLSQDILLDLQGRPPMPYITMDCLTDCCIAMMEHRFVRSLYAEDPAFARRMNESAVRIMYDISTYSGIMRAEGAFAKTVLLMRHLSAYGLFLSNNHISDVLSCDRTTISRMIARVKRELPEVWDAYQANKHRKITVLNP